MNSFQDSQEKAETVDIGGVTVKVLSYNDLILNKRTVNRETDRSDIEEPNKIRKKKREKGITRSDGSVFEAAILVKLKSSRD